MNPHDSNARSVRERVQAGYKEIALHGSKRRQSSCCSGMSNVDSSKLARQLGYSAEDLAGLPQGANFGLSCGNPGALAALRPGEVLLDLGSGAGFDAFIAGPKLGPTGRVIGVDMTPEMLAKARQNVISYRERTGLNNVEFRLGEIEHLPVADGSVDAVISNCVINLSPEKAQVWREIARVLKPGGRVAVSDLALLQPLPPAVMEMVEALVGCIAGAVLISETERMVREAGLTDIRLNRKPGYVESLVEWQDPLYQKILALLSTGAKPGDYITSLEVTATKPTMNNGQAATQVEVFELGSCCADDACPVAPDSPEALFAADLKWLETRGISVSRFRFVENLESFHRNEAVKAALKAQDNHALPLVLVNGEIMSSGAYPARLDLAKAIGLKLRGDEDFFRTALQVASGLAAAVTANNLPAARKRCEQGRMAGLSTDDLAFAVQAARQFPMQSATLEAIERLLAVGTTDLPKGVCCCSGKRDTSGSSGSINPAHEP